MTDSPNIQYARTPDGVDIAYWVMGEGITFCYLPSFPFGQIEMEWTNPERRQMYQHWIERSRVVKYDSRGTGLSGPVRGPITLEDHFKDIDAVMERVGADRFALLGFMHFGRVALAYAAANPDRVSHIVLWCTYRDSREWEGSANGRATRALIEADWHTYSETAPHLVAGWEEGEQGRRLATQVRDGLTPEVALATLDGFAAIDLGDVLHRVQCPALILHRRAFRWPPIETARELAASLANAHLTVLDGSSGGLHLGNTDAVFRAVDGFLGLRGVDPAPAPAPAPSPIHTILFTDVEGSTELTERLGDADSRELLREQERSTRDLLKQHGGTEIKTMGDGFMATFASATGALECAVAIQRALADSDLRVRIGLNAGEPIAEGNDLFGTAVNMAARIAAEANGGEILVSNVVRELVAGKGFLFADRGETALRGFEDPVRIYEVRWQP